MDPSHGRRRMRVEDDRLSSLSDDLIHKILSFTSIKHAIQTSVLSTRWRFIWTSMPYLNFARDDFVSLSKLSEFVTRVLSDRNNQTNVYSVRLRFDGEDSDEFVKQIMTYAFPHNIQQLNVKYLLKKDVEFPLFLFSSRTLKLLSLTKQKELALSSEPSFSYVIKATSTWELPFLTTLYLDSVTLRCDESTDMSICFFSKCANLKKLALKHCYTEGFKSLSICLPILYSLTIVNVYGSVKVYNIVAPQLKNLVIVEYILKELQASTDDIRSLEKAFIFISKPNNGYQVLRLLQRLRNVKSLTLSLEIVELLSSFVELMSNQPSPFANLKSLSIYPLTSSKERQRVKLSAEVKHYLLQSSPGAAFLMVTREDATNMNKTKLAKKLVTELLALLQQEKARSETKMAKMHELGNPRLIEHIDYNDKYMSLQIKKVKEKASHIISKLKEIKGILTKLPASNRATIQPSFSTLCAEANTVTSMITDCLKMECDENQRCLSVRFHELATTLEPSS